MKTLLMPVALLLLAAMTPAFAHGDWKPKHGGTMNEGGETSFELVVQQRKVVFYLEDHGEAIATAGATGTLSIERGATKQVAALKAKASNQLEALAPMKLVAGDRLMAKVTLGNGSIVVGRFVIAR
nr:hypothetical protein [uncultured Roseateles sp.]